MSAADAPCPPGDPSTTTTWAALRAAATPWDPPDVPAVFVVPHPDDEVVLMGGVLRRHAAAGRPTTIVAVTDGEAAYPELDARSLAATRRDEQDDALALLAPGATVHRLGLPDGAVDRHEAAVADAVVDLAPDAGLVVAPWVHDHHVDHEATGRAAAVAAARLGAGLAGALFWAWAHTPAALALPAGLRRVTLEPAELSARDAALACHRSQTGRSVAEVPILAADDLAPLGWGAEHYVVTETA